MARANRIWGQGPAAMALVLVITTSVRATEPRVVPPPVVDTSEATTPDGSTQPEASSTRVPPVTEVRRPNWWLVGGVAAVFAGLVVGGGVISWWRDSGTAAWSWKETGAFGADTYAGGADKAGHAFSFYLITRATAQVYRWLNVPDTMSLALGACFAFLMGNVIELVDGFTPFGFEYGDAIANTTGIGFAVLLEAVPALDGLLGFRIAYVPSKRFLGDKKSYFKLINDYSGMLFYVDLRLSGLERLGVRLGGLRYASLGLAYGTLDYEPKGPNKRRELGFYVGLDVAEILRGVFGDGPAVSAVATIPRYYAIPFTNIIFARELNQHRPRVGFGVPGRVGL